MSATTALVKQLHAQGLSFTQIAKTTGLSRPETMVALQDAGVSKRSVNRVTELTPWAEAILIGTMLGDGHLTRRHAGSSPHLSLSHALKQEAYLSWKLTQLEELFLATAPSRHVDTEGHASVHAASRALPLLRPYYDMFYAGGKKTISKATLDFVAQHDFADAILAVWFGDDGYRSSGNGKSLGYTFGALDDATYDMLADWFDALGYPGTLHRPKRATTYCYYLMKVGAAHRFRDAIEPYLPECMHYKLDIGPRRKIRRSRTAGPAAVVSSGNEV
jgi:hypothetical protein